jgi:hypothetical protein
MLQTILHYFAAPLSKLAICWWRVRKSQPIIIIARLLSSEPWSLERYQVYSLARSRHGYPVTFGCGESVDQPVRNILPSAFFAGQDIPEFRDDSLLFIHSQRENTASAPVCAMSYRSSNWLAACFCPIGENNWTADTMQHAQVYGRKVRRSNSLPAMWPTSALPDSPK